MEKYITTKFILLHLTENAPILFNIGHIITVQPAKNGISSATGTMITVVNDGETDSEGYYIVLESFEYIVNCINRG